MSKTEKQSEFDFQRGRQLSALRSAALPSVKVDQRNVGGRTMKAVLLAIDSRAGKSGECWASAKTLAADSGLTQRAVERALKGLRALSLIIETSVRRGSANCMDRRIVFANLIDFEQVSEPEFHTEPDQVHTEPGASHTERGARSHRTGRAFTPNGVRTKGTEGQIKESIEGQNESSGFSKIQDQENSELTVDQLIEGETLDRIYRSVVSAGHLKDCDASKLLVFGFASRCYRKRKPTATSKALKNPVGFFLDGLTKGRDWLSGQVDDQHDRNTAIKLLKRLRGDSEDRISNLMPCEDESQQLRDFEAERDRQRAALAAECGGLI